MPALMPTLAWRVGRTAWPADWAPPELAPPLQPNPPSGEPFQTYLPPATDTGHRVVRRAGHAGGAATDGCRAAGLLGKPILWAETWRPESVQRIGEAKPVATVRR
jgi:hypothetical protein